MAADDIDDFDIDSMEPIDNNSSSSPYLKHLVIPIKQIGRPSPQPMIFQTPIKTKKIDSEIMQFLSNQAYYIIILSS